MIAFDLELVSRSLVKRVAVFAKLRLVCDAILGGKVAAEVAISKASLKVLKYKVFSIYTKWFR